MDKNTESPYGWIREEIVLGAVWLFLAFVGLHFDLFSGFENKSWDWRTYLTANPKNADSSIKIVVIDQGSIDYFANEESIFWPWPRPLYGRVVEFLERAGARGVAFDLLFTESQFNNASDDLEFARSLKRAIPVVSAVSLNPGDGTFDGQRFSDFREIQQRENQRSAFEARLISQEHPARFSAATFPLQMVMVNSSALGNVWGEADADGVFRHYIPGGYMAEVPVLGLPISLYNTVLGSNAPEISLDKIVDGQGKLAVRFHGGNGVYESVPIANVISSMSDLESGKTPRVDPKTFENAWVFIGVWAPGLLDLRPSPLAKEYRGVEFNATVLDNLIHQNFIRKSNFWQDWIVSCCLILLSLAAILALNEVRFQGYALAALTTLFMGGAYFAAASGIWFKFVIPLFSMIGSIITATVFRYRQEGEERKFLRGAFTHYLSDAVIEQIVQDPSLLSLGGERRKLTILFTDIEGFTAFSEHLDAARLSAFLNPYLTAITNVILEYGGTVDKYQGDAVMAFWNAPLQLDDHASQAVKAALACEVQLKTLHNYFQTEFGTIPRTRIGIHTGSASVGNFGSDMRFNYTAIGDAANLASRLEGLNKYFRTNILVSEETKSECKSDITFRKVGDVQVAGRAGVVGIYEPLHENKVIGSVEELKVYEASRSLFEDKNFVAAMAGFLVLTEDPVAQAYVSRIEKEGLSALPDEEWSPVWSFTSK